MTHLTDDRLGDLLSETFAAHEHLADPDTAARIAAAPHGRRHVGRALVGAAAAVSLVAGGTTYALSRGAGEPQVSTGPPQARTHRPPLPQLETDAGNRAKAAAAALEAIRRMPAYPGARRSEPIADLQDGTSVATTPGYTVVTSRWWTVDSTEARVVAQWYSLHPPRGFRSEDGSLVSSSSDGTTTVYIADLVRPGSSSLPPSGVTIEVQTTAVAGGRTGIRVSALSVWPPARPVASYVQDATSIVVHVTHTAYWHGRRTTHRSFTVRDPHLILKAETVFDSLDGTGPVAVSCPVMAEVYLERAVFHTPSGDVTVTTGGGCVDIATVRRDGRIVGPALAHGSLLMRSLGLTR